MPDPRTDGRDEKANLPKESPGEAPGEAPGRSLMFHVGLADAAHRLTIVEHTKESNASPA
jgi:hypothetical protein